MEPWTRPTPRRCSPRTRSPTASRVDRRAAELAARGRARRQRRHRVDRRRHRRASRARPPSRGPILTAGVAALVAGALSMAVGEYVSVSTQRDTERALLAKERRELREEPEAELAELADLYEDKGLDPELARRSPMQLTAHDALGAARGGRAGIDPDDLHQPVARGVRVDGGLHGRRAAAAAGDRAAAAARGVGAGHRRRGRRSRSSSPAWSAPGSAGCPRPVRWPATSPAACWPWPSPTASAAWSARRVIPSPHQKRVPGSPLKGPTTRDGDPAAVEAALLGPHHLAVDRAPLHRAGITATCPAQRLEAAARASGSTRRPRRDGIPAAHVEVRGLALELAPRRPLAWSAAHRARSRRPAGSRSGVAGLEHPQRPGRQRDARPAEPDLDALGARLDARRAGVAPDRLLPRPRLHPLRRPLSCRHPKEPGVRVSPLADHAVVVPVAIPGVLGVRAGAVGTVAAGVGRPGRGREPGDRAGHDLRGGRGAGAGAGGAAARA